MIVVVEILTVIIMMTMVGCVDYSTDDSDDENCTKKMVMIVMITVVVMIRITMMW